MKRILVLSRSSERDAIKKNLGRYIKMILGPEMAEKFDPERVPVDYHSHTNTLPEAITGSDIPHLKSTWCLPDIVVYTGNMRQYSPEGGFTMDVSDPKYLKRLIQAYGIDPGRLIRVIL